MTYFLRLDLLRFVFPLHIVGIYFEGDKRQCHCHKTFTQIIL